MDEAAWRQTLHAVGNRLKLQPPADPGEIAAVERQLGIAFPAELRALYAATNGIYDRPGQWFVMWPLADVANSNLAAWSGGAPEARQKLLGFGDDGTGAPFCIAVDGEPIVLTWSPIAQEVRPLAATLHEFWLSWLSGDIRT
ncbi:SMI1/KNR4 family protein [Kribbella sindirgiensis]|uniref:SMI1/KNR4 family protein n=1 Tax=Kribbella sindirgiensis TaxID=1124744 RepID=UPI0013F4139E|nr:SMI1/KNR4 family protein [Kribbella sindirgiensis]